MTLTEPMDDTYFRWLCAKVLDRQAQHTSNYHDLLRILYSTEFYWVVRGDHNREADGVELRTDFLRELNVENDPLWFEGPCSVLEMFIAFSKRAEFQTTISAKKWFWKFLENLELNEYRQMSPRDVHHAQEILNMFVGRTYRADGTGGILPMRSPRKDQREVEIWYQFFAYLDDQGL